MDYEGFLKANGIEDGFESKTYGFNNFLTKLTLDERKKFNIGIRELYKHFVKLSTSDEHGLSDTDRLQYVKTAKNIRESYKIVEKSYKIKGSRTGYDIT